MAEIEFFKEYAIFYGTVTERLADGRLPLAVTHNDTKINNILFDAEDGHPLAVIDLDTVMPGSRLYDFGDALRTHRPRHNLDRARNQIKQAKEIEKLLPELHEIVKNCLAK